MLDEQLIRELEQNVQILKHSRGTLDQEYQAYLAQASLDQLNTLILTLIEYDRELQLERRINRIYSFVVVFLGISTLFFSWSGS